MLRFETIKQSKSSRARAGVIQTRHGRIETPVFMPVGTLGTVKSLSPEELMQCGAQIILGNTYHLYLRPGTDVIDQFEGLHDFMNWHGPILTDSGGFQIFSLAKLAKIKDDGITFQSHIDGSRHLLTPETAIDIQTSLGSDIMMCLDNCVSYPATIEQTQKALKQTTLWAGQCKTRWQDKAYLKHALFGIVQGGMYRELREKSIEELTNMDFSGYAVGGVSVGEPTELMYEIADFSIPRLPDGKPKYVMGVGMPQNLLEMIAMGADMFDCVVPTRNARNGQLFTRQGTINICNAKFKTDKEPIDPQCSCYTCRHYSKAYLRHLYMARELLVYRLHTLHNIHFFIHLLKDARTAILNDQFESFKQTCLSQMDNG